MKRLLLVASFLLAAAVSLSLASAAFGQGNTTTPKAQEDTTPSTQESTTQQAHSDSKKKPKKTFDAVLAPLNNSGASGTAKLGLNEDKIATRISSEGMTPNLPHAQHIHGMAEAISECPSLAADTNGDGLVSTTEGQPFYGPIQVSLTTKGDTSPSSGLAVDRFPVADADGKVDYSRTLKIPKKVAKHLGDFAIVQHGVDVNGDGVYDGPPSDLDPNVPLEATLPATCGKIVPVSS